MKTIHVLTIDVNTQQENKKNLILVSYKFFELIDYLKATISSLNSCKYLLLKRYLKLPQEFNFKNPL